MLRDASDGAPSADPTAAPAPDDVAPPESCSTDPVPVDPSMGGPVDPLLPDPTQAIDTFPADAVPGSYDLQQFDPPTGGGVAPSTGGPYGATPHQQLAGPIDDDAPSPGHGSPDHGAWDYRSESSGASSYRRGSSDAWGYGNDGSGASGYGTPGLGASGPAPAIHPADGPEQTAPAAYGSPAYPGYDPRYPAAPQHPGYPADPHYPGGYDQYAYPAKAPTNAMAVLALVFAFVVPPLGMVFGFVARRQIKRTGESGHGVALAGLVVGGIFTAFIVLFVVLAILAFALAVGTAG